MQTVQAREQMVSQQVRTCEVPDDRVLAVLRSVPRERFVPQRWCDVAFADADIPLSHGKFMLRPMVVGRILQAVQVQPADKVLEIGTGSGYLSACLGRLGAQVRSVEIHADLADTARANLAADSRNVEVVTGDGMLLTEESTYDVVILTASLATYETRFELALKPGGRLFVAVGTPQLQQARLVRKRAGGKIDVEDLFETAIEPMESAPVPPSFVF